MIIDNRSNLCAFVAQLPLTLCGPLVSSLPGSSVCGILQARILEWVDIPSPGDLPNPGIEMATGRKVRGLQMEEIGCKCQTFFISFLSGRRKQTTSVRYFPFSIQN